MNIENLNYYIKDISDKDKNWIVNNCNYIGLDTETTGLDPLKDKLCLVQIAAKDRYFIIKFDEKQSYNNLVQLLTNEKIIKIFHHATFDARFLMKSLHINSINNVVCTKIAAKIIHGLNHKNSLKDLLFKYLNVSISKDQQVSNWCKEELSCEQFNYAINDVKYLVELWKILEEKLIKENLMIYAKKSFEFLPTQAHLANIGIKNIFDY